MKTNIVDESEDYPLEIVRYPHPALSRQSDWIKEITDEIRALAGNMIGILYKAHGVALAAPQVGMNSRLIVLDPCAIDQQLPQTRPFAAINPRIIKTFGQSVEEEGCLSLPGLWANVSRPTRLTVEYTSLDGDLLEYEASGMMARCFAHEIDHLDGILFWDRLGKGRRLWYKVKFRRQMALA